MRWTWVMAGLLIGCSDGPVRDAACSAVACSAGTMCVDGACHPLCNDDSHCSGGDECVDGLCMQPHRPAQDPLSSPECGVDADCSTPGTCETTAGASCVMGTCRYSPMTCDAPPASRCVDTDILRTYSATGGCAADTCTYQFSQTHCTLGCSNGACIGCNSGCTPPADACVSATTLRRYSADGACTSAGCEFPHEDVSCTYGCERGACAGCQPRWTDTSMCECNPSACGGCDGTKTQTDGCGNARTVSCSVAATCEASCCGDSCCGTSDVCYEGACCQPDCSAGCGDDGCGGSCGACPCDDCDGGEACVDDACVPLVVTRVSEGANMPVAFACPTGYTEVGHWRTGPGRTDGNEEGHDDVGNTIDNGWVWLCSADPTRARVVIGHDDCDVFDPGVCDGKIRGAWHVGTGCTSGLHGIDADGTGLQAGWLRLCVGPSVELRARPVHDDCGGTVTGCNGQRVIGQWHTDPATCTGGTTGSGSGESIVAGWMGLCGGPGPS